MVVAEADKQGWGWPDETVPPESVAVAGKRWRKGKDMEIASVHNQIVRIREEDSHLGEDIVEFGSSAMDHKTIRYDHANLMILSRPILPSSPLRGRTNC